MRSLFFHHDGPRSYADTAIGMESARARYRLYVLDRFDGRIRSFHEIDAKNDAAAVKAAERVRSINPMVLWSRTRKVRQWELLQQEPQFCRPRASRRSIEEPLVAQERTDVNKRRCEDAVQGLRHVLHQVWPAELTPAFSGLLRAIDEIDEEQRRRHYPPY